MAKKDTNNIDIIKELTKSDLNEPIKDKMLEETIKNLNGGESGLMEKVFGTRNPGMFVAFTVALVILIVGAFCTWLFKESAEMVKELWNIFIPALTLVIGYALGVKKQ